MTCDWLEDAKPDMQAYARHEAAHRLRLNSGAGLELSTCGSLRLHRLPRVGVAAKLAAFTVRRGPPFVWEPPVGACVGLFLI